MGERTLGRGPGHAKFVEEFKVMLALAAYLYICFGAVILFKSAVLREAGIHYAIWGIAAIKALLLAKFLLLGRMLHVGTRYRDKPLIWPTLYHALMFLIVLLILTTVEELIVGFIHGRAAADSLNHVVGPIFFEGLAVCLIMFLILVPYSAFTCLSDVVGEHETIRLFFVSRDADGVVRSRLHMPPTRARDG
jgi:hypothetical protein